MKSRIFLTIIGLMLVLFCYSSAQVPQLINYQGKLTKPTGAPLDTTIQMVFTIYADSNGVTSLWTETQTAVAVQKGVFNVLLGSVVPVSYSTFDGTTRYLGVKVGGDPEITPRKPMVSVPYAMRSGAGGGGSDNDWIYRITDTADTSITTGGNWGIARYGAVMYGDMDSTHVNLGVACTTGTTTKGNKYCTIAGGLDNTASESATSVGGGYSNIASGFIATVAGGDSNTASASLATVGGGHNNLASGIAATVPGGALDTAAGDFSVALGQQVIISPDADFTFAFGSNFITNASHAVIFKDTQIPIKVGIGTSEPTERLDVDGTVQMTGFKMPTGAAASRVLTSDAYGVGTWQAASSGGDLDWTYRITDTADTTLITGGAWGIARSGNVLYGNADSTHVNLGVASTTGTNGQNYMYCTVGGGVSNTASGYAATVGGGFHNTASINSATVGGGWTNTASGNSTTVGGGNSNTASNSNATVGGGFHNIASSISATVGGGYYNIASDIVTTVAGGYYNLASGAIATVGGGYSDTASGSYATVPGGYGNNAAGDYSFAAGRRAKAIHSSSFVWGDDTNEDFVSTSVQQFLIRASGGVGIGKNNPAQQLDVNGTVQMTGFKMPNGAAASYILTSDASGVGTWQVAGGDKDWAFRITDAADTSLITRGAWGIARYGNMLYGNADSTHINLGVACTTGYSGQNYKYNTVGGGLINTASGWGATVSGGIGNLSSSDRTIISGGEYNIASGQYATVGGGRVNQATNYSAVVGGGEYNFATGSGATVAGGDTNYATKSHATVAGGQTNNCNSDYSSIGGGYNNNIQIADFSTIGGGHSNQITGLYSTVPGGYHNWVEGDYSLAAGSNVSLSSSADYTFAFGNNFTTTASHAVIFHDSGTPIKVGLGTTSPNTTTDINGDLALRAGSFVAANGNNNDIVIGARSYVRITGPAGAFAITGIVGGQDGKVVILYNTTAQNMTIANNSVNSHGGNKILTMSGGDDVTTGTGNVTLIYDATSTYWIVTAIKP